MTGRDVIVCRFAVRGVLSNVTVRGVTVLLNCSQRYRISSRPWPPSWTEILSLFFFCSLSVMRR